MNIVVLKFCSGSFTKVFMHQTNEANDIVEFVRNNDDIKLYYKLLPKNDRVIVKVMIYSFEYNDKNDKVELKERVLGEFVTPSTLEKTVWKTDIETKFPIVEN